jgi:hypothetical protein
MVAVKLGSIDSASGTKAAREALITVFMARYSSKSARRRGKMP